MAARYWREYVELAPAMGLAPANRSHVLMHLVLHLTLQDLHAEAEPFPREALEIKAGILPGSLRLLSAMSVLGQNLLGQDRLEEAEEVLRRAVELGGAREARGAPQATVARNRALVLLRKGELEEAEAFATRAIETWQDLFGHDHSGLGHFLDTRAAAARARGRHDVAARDYRTLLDLEGEALAPETRARFLALLGDSLLELGLAGEAGEAATGAEGGSLPTPRSSSRTATASA